MAQTPSPRRARRLNTTALAASASVAPYRAIAPQKKEKAILRAHWGDWRTCKDKLPHDHARTLVAYLESHPADFRGAIARLRPELRGLYLSAYQSHLWNRMLARWLPGAEHLEISMPERRPLSAGLADFAIWTFESQKPLRYDEVQALYVQPAAAEERRRKAP